MSQLFHLILTQPFANILVILYSYITFHDLGFAIIALTILIRLVLYPIFYRGLKGQSLMQKIQPEIQKAQEQNKGNREAQATAVMEIYKKNKVNPFGPFFYLLLQLPILIAVYRLFAAGFNTTTLSQLYSFVPAPTQINTLFLGMMDLSKPNLIIVALAVISQYIQGKMALPQVQAGQPQAKTAAMSKYMVYMGPLLTLIILPRFSSAIGLYWLTTSVFSIFQQRIINKKIYGTSLKP